MLYSYTPTYYSTLHDSITSLCKNILPFSFKKKRLLSAEQRLSKLQSDNLKWQQDSYHQILNLMGLQKEGILGEAEVAAFRTHLLESLIASPPELEQPVILRDKLVFLQELLYAKCITEEEYHSSKRPLLQRLAIQGAEIESRDVIVANSKDSKENQEGWSVIDLKDEGCINNRDNMLHSRNISKNSSTMKQIKESASVLGFGSSQKPVTNRSDKSIFDVDSRSSAFMLDSKENPFWNSNFSGKESEAKSILMQEEILPNEPMKENSSGTDKVKRKPFRTLFQREQREGHGGGGGGNNCPVSEEKASKSAKKQWGFDGFKKWKRNNSEDETAPLTLSERSDNEASLGSCNLAATSVGEGPDTKQIKHKLHANGAPSDFSIDQVLGDKIKMELSRIQTELSTTNPNLKSSNDQIEAISTTLPVDKADLKKFFPKSWCERYGDVVLDVVKKEFKDHAGEMENMRYASKEKHNSMRWTTFEDDENCHPNLFAATATSKDFKYNPFSYDHKLRPESVFFHQHQNPFWNNHPKHS